MNQNDDLKNDINDQTEDQPVDKEDEEAPEGDLLSGIAEQGEQVAPQIPEGAETALPFDFSIEGADTSEQKTDFGIIRPRYLEQEMQESYLDYAMSVIISRALPDVRDGLKPVHRRVLYSMSELGLTAHAKYRKSATVVGDVLGKYHPHGDSAVYESLVRMAQDFSMGQRLVDGQGNFGSIDGDSAAAMRYTECRMTSIAEEMLSDIDKDTVDFTPNYDGSRTEPKVLPSKVPNLLLNGAMGIAVGMATNIPPHNLGELTDATTHLIENPEANVEDLMQFVKGPDFPTGAEVYGLSNIKQAYSTGKGSIVMRAVANIEELKRGGFRIIVSQIPYQVNKAELISKIADLVKDKKIEGISGLRDESDRTEGIRIVIDLKSNAFPKKILNRLYELTNMQTSFHVNLLALVDGIQPKVLTLKNVLQEFIKHRQIVVRRRTEFDLARAKERAHILEGLLVALKNIDAVINLIRASKNRDEAQKGLMEKFDLSLAQANAILDMRLSALAALERQKVEDEYKEKINLIKELEGILASEEKILSIIKKELKEVKDKFNIERRTKIFEQEIGKFQAEDLIPSENVVVMLTRGNYVKRMPVSAYRSQVRGGRGVMGMETKEEDVIEHMLAANTHDDILFFTDRGRVFQTKVYDIPATSRLSKGQAIVNILQISPEEKVTAVISFSAKERDHIKYYLMATIKGVVKKTAVEQYKNVRKTGIVAIKLNPGDKLKWVQTTSGQDKVFMASAKGQSIFYNETDIRPMGRGAAGVRGIHLRSDDVCIGVDIVKPGDDAKSMVLAVLENGFGKRTPLTHFKMQLRGGMGIRVANVTPRTGRVVAMTIVKTDKADVILATKNGQIIRMSLDTIKVLSRDTQGVTLVKLKEPDKVATVTVVPEEPEVLNQEGQGDETIDDQSKEEIIEEINDSENELQENSTIEEEEVTQKDENNEIPEWATVHRDVKGTDGVKETVFEEPPKKDEDQQEINFWGGGKK